MNAQIPMPAGMAPPPASRAGSVIGRVLLHCLFLLLAVGLFAGYQHFSLSGQSTQSLACLVGAAGFGLAPIRALVSELFTLERKALHLLHGAGGLLVAGLSVGGVISGGPLLTHAALAPFAIMGAAQAIMHQDHPRNAQQAEALRRFATSLPEVEQFTKSGDLASPENAARAVSVLTDLITKAQALGETELQADPGFQGALKKTTTRFGLTLGLDTVDQIVGKLAANPAAARAVPELRRQLAKARKTVEQK
jgi:hypothetical protein